jgi:RND family efflux transporter MFP subunit
MRVRVFIMVAALTLTLGVAIPLLTGCGNGAGQHSTAKKAQYHCPMHPTVVSDKPGDCPICGMRLVPMDDGQKHEDPAAMSATPAAAATAKKKTMYRSTMNPNEVSDKPGKDSMGMEMVPFEVTGGGEPTPSGLAVVSITPAARERMGITLGVVDKRALSRDVRTSAKIVADETRLYKVTTKIDGYVGKLFVSVTGQEVKKGDPLLTIYSPDLVSAEQEYLIALQTKQKLTASNPEASKGGESLLEAARRRLELWDISDEQVEQLEKSGKVEKFLTLYAPASGWVTEKDVLAGQKIMPGETLLVVSGLDNVWGDADIYESDLPYVKVGMTAEITLPYWPDKTFTGEVFFVSPTLDPETRTLKARITIPNADLLLKPEMYANAKLSYQLGEKLAVPKAAVMRTGERSYAFRDAGEGKLIPVEVKLGIRSDGYYEVLSGLQEGDHVVTSANFLVDSESSMKAAIEALAGK